jgi:integral membrane protein (TIGR01906 family)
MKRHITKALIIGAGVLFVVCIPALLLTTNLRFAANEIRLYEYGFDKYDVSAAMGMEKDELLQVAGEMIDYFNSDDEFLDLDVFDERETAHMKDVKGLVRLAYLLQMISLGFVAVYIAVSFVLKRGAFWRGLAGGLIWGGWTTIALLAALGIWAAIDFDSLFLAFHLSSFSNDLWQLSPGDSLLLMFPEGFFNDATLFVAGATIVEALIIGALGWGIIVVRRRRHKKALLQYSSMDGESGV